jgi:TRAP-type C4-dicarboxylate transport system permease small subunit
VGIADKLVLNRQRHLKWRALDKLELALMIVCGLTLFGFSLSVSLDILTRTIGRPWLWLQEVTSTLFIYGIFAGTAAAGCLIYFGYLNYLRGFGSFRLPSNTPIASLYAAIPLCGVLVALFTVEQIVNGLRNGFDHPEPEEPVFPVTPIDTAATGGPRS